MKAFSLAETTWIIIIYIRHASYNPSDIGLCELRLVQFKPTPCNNKKTLIYISRLGVRRSTCFPRTKGYHVLSSQWRIQKSTKRGLKAKAQSRRPDRQRMGRAGGGRSRGGSGGRLEA
jgi:hypothetical protein